MNANAPDVKELLPRQTVLIVDDTPQNITVLGELLHPHYAVRAANSGERALRAAHSDPRPDIILLDVMMPGMDGPQTLLQLRELVDIQQVPVAFMTAKVQPAEIEHYLSLGARDVITKPFDPMQLANQVQKIWACCQDTAPAKNP